MGTAQTSINPAGQPIAFAGMVLHRIDSASAVNKEASSAMRFGIGVKPGTKEQEMLLPTSASSVLAGIVASTHAKAPGTFGGIDQSATPPGVVAGGQFELLRKGRCWVHVDADTAITPRVTRAHWRAVSDGGSNTIVGTFRHNQDSTNTVDVTGQVLFVSGVRTAADGTKIAEVEIDATSEI